MKGRRFQNYGRCKFLLVVCLIMLYKTKNRQNSVLLATMVLMIYIVGHTYFKSIYCENVNKNDYVAITVIVV